MQDLKLKINEFAKKLIDLNEGDYNLHFFVGYLSFEFFVNNQKYLFIFKDLNNELEISFAEGKKIMVI